MKQPYKVLITSSALLLYVFALNSPEAAQPAPTRVYAAAPACTSFSCADRNRDGRLSSGELSSRGDATRTLPLLDINGDGSVDEQEWESFEQIDLPGVR